MRPRALPLLVSLLLACEEPPPPEPIRLGTASTSAREQIDQATHVHDYVAAYRRVLRMELRPAEADRMLRVNVSETHRAEPRFLACLTADRVTRTFAPLALELAGLRPAASRLRELPAIADRASARRAAAELGRVRRDFERERESARSPHQGVVDGIAHVLAETEALVEVIQGADPIPASHGERAGRVLMSVLALYPEGSSRDAVVNVGIALLRDLSQAGRTVIIPAGDPSYPAQTAEEGS